jgi:hypothetical protein
MAGSRERSISPAPMRRTSLLALALVALAGLALRLWLAQGDLWLDEIWSWKLGQDVRLPWDVWRVAHDNNHPLNTLWMRAVGESSSALPYRALSVASGTVAVVCAGLLGARRDAFTGLACAILAASSTLLAYYSAEARGYAPAVACFLGGWLALERAEESGRWRPTVLWWICAALGLAAHFTFVFGWAALAAGTLVHARARFAKLQAVPAAIAAAIYFGFVRRMGYGGGDEWSWQGVWVQGLCWTFGAPETVPWAVLGSLLLLGALLVERRAALVPALLLLVPPLATALLLHPDFVALRYFSVPLAGATILLGRALGRLARWAGILLLSAIAALNLARDAELARAGRGQFRAALEYMAANTDGPAVSFGTDLPLETSTTVEYHARGLGKTVSPGFPADWLIVTRAQHPPQLEAGGQRFVLRRVFEGAGPSAYTWALYRRAQ